MSQHIQSNTDLSNNSNINYDDAFGGFMHDLSHQESNATDRSSESASLLPNGPMGITLMGLNHLQSSPLQQFVNPNIGAPILEIPSKVEIPAEITPNGDVDADEKQKLPDVQIPIDDENKEFEANDRDAPITPADPSYPYPPNLSPLPQQHNKAISDLSAPDISQIVNAMNFLPQFVSAFQVLSRNVSDMQQEIAKIAAGKVLNMHSAHSSSQTRYRSQSSHSQSNSINSLRTQTSIASSNTYNNTINSLTAHGVIYSNSNNESFVLPHRTLKRRSSAFNPNIPSAKTERTSSRLNRPSSPNPRNKKTNFLGPNHRKSSVYNKYSKYPRRKSIGPGGKPTISPRSSASFVHSPKGRRYQLTADSLELLHISHQSKKLERREENKNEEHNENMKKSLDPRQRNRSQSQNHRPKRRTISEVSNNKMEDEAFSDEDDEFLDDEVSLYSDKYGALSVQTPTQPHGLSIIHSKSEFDGNAHHILFEEVEGNGNGNGHGKEEQISNKFHRKKSKTSLSNVSKDRKPSSSNASSTTLRSNSELSISSIAITDPGNEHTIVSRTSRSLPHSPELINEEIITTKQPTKGGTFVSRHLYPTPSHSKTPIVSRRNTPTKIPTLTQSLSAHNIHAIKATTPQRPNTPKTNLNQPIEKVSKTLKTNEYNPTTPRNTPNATAVDAVNAVTPPNAYDINYRNSLTPPQEDKEQDDIYIQHVPVEQSDDDMDGHLVIVDDEEMIINADTVQEVQIYNGTYSTADTVGDHHRETQINLVEGAAHILFTNSSEQERRNGEDSVSLSMTSSRPPSTKLNKNVHFDMNSIKNEYSIHDIEEYKVSADEQFETISHHHNLLPSQVKNHRKRGKTKGIQNKRGNDKILKLKNHIAYHHQNGKNRRGNLRKLRLSQKNLKAHNGLNQLKNKLMDAKLEQKEISKMTSDQLQEMLVYINRIQWLILDEKHRRECCKICGSLTTSSALLLPCEHQTVCYNCSSTVKNCPICHQSVTQVIFPKR